MRILFLLPLAAALLHAEVTVNPPIPIKYRIQLRCVQVASTSGSFATVLGTEFQRDYIESQVDRVFAQMGVDVSLFPATNVWTNNFAFDGGVGDNELRPASDFSGIFNSIPDSYHDEHSGVITIVFLHHVPGFLFTSSNYVGGWAYIGGNGIAMAVGSNLTGSTQGMDSIAMVLSHEICHNLSLQHVQNSSNLMNAAVLSGRLEAPQIESVLTQTGTAGFLAAIGPPELFISQGMWGLPGRITFTRSVESYTLERSSDLNSWVRAENVALVYGIYVHRPEMTTGRQFFRARQTPGLPAPQPSLSNRIKTGSKNLLEQGSWAESK